MKFYVFEDAEGRMLSPSFFYGGVTAPIDENGKMFGAKFAPGQDLPPAGTMMVSRIVRVNPEDRYASCGAYVVDEVQAFQLAEQVRNRELHRAEDAARARRVAERAAKDREFNASLRIPVAFRPAQKIVLNGLYEGNGSGANRASVGADHRCDSGARRTARCVDRMRARRVERWDKNRDELP